MDNNEKMDEETLMEYSFANDKLALARLNLSVALEIELLRHSHDLTNIDEKPNESLNFVENGNYEVASKKNFKMPIFKRK